MAETALYPSVKRFLEAAGFVVKGEVCGCDIVAVRDGEPPLLAIVEMKRGFNLELLLQAVDRVRPADEVWLAVPMTRRGRDRDPRVRRLCRLIGLGLLAVDAARDRVEVLTEPGPYRPRPDQRRRTRLLSEHTSRRGDPSPGGSTRQPIMTAYRQRALACAAGLRAGPGRPRDLRAAAARRRPNPAAQCLWLVRAHRARTLPPDLPWRSCPAALARSGPGDCTVAQGLLAAMTVPSCHRAQSEAISGGAAGQPAFII